MPFQKIYLKYFKIKKQEILTFSCLYFYTNNPIIFAIRANKLNTNPMIPKTSPIMEYFSKKPRFRLETSDVATAPSANTNPT